MISLDCHSANLIYLITLVSTLLYLGETVQKSNERINGHKTGLEIPKNLDTVKFFVNILLLEFKMQSNIKFK